MIDAVLPKRLENCQEKLRKIMLAKEFKRCLRPDIKQFSNEKKAVPLDEAACLADDYSLTPNTSFGNTSTLNKAIFSKTSNW